MKRRKPYQGHIRERRPGYYQLIIPSGIVNDKPTRIVKTLCLSSYAEAEKALIELMKESIQLGLIRDELTKFRLNITIKNYKEDDENI